MSKPPAPPSASKGFWFSVIGVPSGSWGCCGCSWVRGVSSWMLDLLDHGRPELAGEQVLAAEPFGVGIEVVAADHGVGGREVVGPRRRRTHRPGLLDRL